MRVKKYLKFFSIMLFLLLGSFFVVAGDVVVQNGQLSVTNGLEVNGTLQVNEYLNMTSNNKICFNSDCTAWMCHNGTDILISNNEAGVTC